MPAAKPEDFRLRAVALARSGEKPVVVVAKDLGVSETRLRRTESDSAADLGLVKVRTLLRMPGRLGELLTQEVRVVLPLASHEDVGHHGFSKWRRGYAGFTRRRG